MEASTKNLAIAGAAGAAAGAVAGIVAERLVIAIYKWFKKPAEAKKEEEEAPKA